MIVLQEPEDSSEEEEEEPKPKTVPLGKPTPKAAVEAACTSAKCVRTYIILYILIMMHIAFLSMGNLKGASSDRSMSLNKGQPLAVSSQIRASVSIFQAAKESPKAKPADKAVCTSAASVIWLVLVGFCFSS